MIEVECFAFVLFVHYEPEPTGAAGPLDMFYVYLRILYIFYACVRILWCGAYVFQRLPRVGLDKHKTLAV